MMNGERRKVFVDDKLDYQFEEDGYLIVNLLNEDDLKQLESVFNRLDSKVTRGFYTSLWSPDKEYRLQAYKLISEVIEKKAKNLFIEYSPLFADFIVKLPNEESQIGQHQDWMFVDESKYNSLIVWCPLVDVEETNGAIEIVKHSHLFYNEPRGANIPAPFHQLPEHIDENYLTPVYLKKGQAIIFSHKLIHGSKSNRSSVDRVAAGMVMAPNEAEIYHYHMKPGSNTIEKIKVPRDYYLNYNYNKDFIEKIMEGDITRPPGGEVVEVIPYKINPTSKEVFDNLYANYNPK